MARQIVVVFVCCLLLAVVVVTAGCETMHGFGKDMQTGGAVLQGQQPNK